jgi:tRNA modification GTPase
MKNVTDTIVAAATPPGRGGVAIVRVSGSLVNHVAIHLLKKTPEPRYATYSNFLDEANNPIDEGIALFFPGPHSFTGEDVLELQGHGGPAVVDCLIQRILTLGVRLARPGEFSERAFLNDKMDLAQAEAIADLIDAASEQAARNALRSLQGEFSKKIHVLVEALIRLRIYVEAAIDFVEEEIDFLSGEQVSNDLINILKNLAAIQASATQGSLLRDGITAVIAGQPNVGKSSLLNQLSGKDSAIVTDIPGTTRDVLREHILIDGMPMHIIDTAGLRDSDDRVEQEGIRRARNEIVRADIVIFVKDATHSDSADLLAEIPEHAALITVRNKIDLLNETPSLVKENQHTIISLSAKAGLGIDLLKTHIKACAGFNTNIEGNFSARRRHLDALTRARNFLLNGQQQLVEHRAGELLAEDLRLAQNALNEITGEFSSDDLLGRIFGSFCIGK